MNIQLEQYIQKHKVSSANFLVFRDWEEFLNILFLNNGHVEMIIWYEYCRINEQQIGMGGYIDEEKRGYMWAETQIYEVDFQDETLTEVLDYIKRIRSEYTQRKMYPAFYLYDRE